MGTNNLATSLYDIKGARAQSIGLKSTYLQIWLGKSLSKEMWCNMK